MSLTSRRTANGPERLHLADRLGLLPADIVLVGVRHQRQPIVPRLAANLHVNASGIIARRNGRLTIPIGAAVDRVLNHSVDGGVVRAPPSRLAILPLRRQIEIMLVEPERSLASAVEFQAQRPGSCRVSLRSFPHENRTGRRSRR
jgi:hypothetical protein